MRPPDALTGAAAEGWSPPRPSALARTWRRWRLLRIGSTVLAIAVLAGLAWHEAPALRSAHRGTAFLGTATCSDWQDASRNRRLDIVAALGLAATAPDPENRGATLDEGAAYSLFQRACATGASGSSLLYEVYNRAASFQPAAVAPVVRQGGFGTAAHR